MIQLNDTYILKTPTPQNIVDLFQGEWSSKFPNASGLVSQPGSAGLFEDARVAWAQKHFSGFAGWNILELGPLEGGHSYMFQQTGAASVTAIEANTRSFLKCLCVKELFGLDRVHFMLGDFNEYLKTSSTPYDMVFASGVLYHMIEPVELIKLISAVSSRLVLWTHYYDESIIKSQSHLSHKFDKKRSFKYDGQIYEYSTQEYKEALGWAGFCGGPRNVSKWLSRESILRALQTYGFSNIEIGFDQSDHQNGPAFALCASKPN